MFKPNVMTELEISIVKARAVLDAAPMGKHPHYCYVNGVLLRQLEPDGEVDIVREESTN